MKKWVFLTGILGLLTGAYLLLPTDWGRWSFYQWVNLGHLAAGVVFGVLLIPYMIRHVRRVIEKKNQLQEKKEFFLGGLLTLIILLVLGTGLAMTFWQPWPWMREWHRWTGLLVLGPLLFHSRSWWREQRPVLLKGLAMAAVGFAGVLVLANAQWPAAKAVAAEADANYKKPFGDSLFAPADTATVHGKLVNESALGPSDATCGTCHSQIYENWKNSLHGHSSTDFFYEKIEEKFEKELNPEAVRFCAGCHTPAGLLAGQIGSLQWEGRAAQEGTSCVVCHTAQGGVPKGENGAFLSAAGETRTYLFDGSTGALGRWLNMILVKTQPEPHKADLRPAYLSASESCGACHNTTNVLAKAPIEPTFSEWLHSPYNTGDPATAVTCQDCHMTPGMKEFKANPGVNVDGGIPKAHVWDHRLPGASTAVPFVNRDEEQLALNQASLRSAAVMEFLAWERTPQGYRATIRVTNTGAGHHLPTGADDLREMWLEVKVTDARGRVVYHSGHVDDDGFVDAQAFRFGSVPGDAEGKPLMHHEVWRFTQKLKDTRIPAKGYRDVPYEIQVPADAQGPLNVEARLRWRDFSQEFANVIFRNDKNRMPITDMAEDSLTLPWSSQ